MGILFVGIPATLSKAGLAAVVSGSRFSGANPQGSLGFTRETFSPYLNTTFRVKTDSGTTSLKLIATADLKSGSLISSRIAGKESFSLLFERGARGKAFAQDTYLIEHAALGKFSLFVVPVGSESGEHYEAVFTRL
jgi:hypothetical protein